jgi:integrase
MGIYEHGKGSGQWRLRVRWRGLLSLSLAVPDRKTAATYEELLLTLKGAGRVDLLRWVEQNPGGLFHLRRAVQSDGVMNVKAENILPSEKTGPTVAKLVSAFLDYCRKPGGVSRRKGAYRASTIDDYEKKLATFMEWLPKKGDTLVSAVEPETLGEFHREIAARPRKRSKNKATDGATASPFVTMATANRYTTAVQALFSWAADPAKSPKQYRTHRLHFSQAFETRPEPKALTNDEIKALREHCPKEVWPIFEVAIGTGLRIAEVQFLRRTDIELDAQKRPAALIVREHPDRPLKGQKSARTVPIPPAIRPTVAAALAAGKGVHLWPEQWRQSAKSKGGNPSPRGYYFLEWRFSKACAAAKVKATIHSLRHTYGCRLVDAGVPARDIADLMGHEDIATTQRYWDTRDKRERAALAMKKAAALFDFS